MAATAAGSFDVLRRKRGAEINEDVFQEALFTVKSLFHIERVKPEQEFLIRSFFKGKNIYFSAPTGFGKSFVFQALPYMADVLLELALGTSILIVIFPLHSLMLDQVEYLNNIGLNAAAIFKDQDECVLKDIEEGIKNVVFVSPESMIATERWRKLMSSETFSMNCIGIAVDEAHCISTW